MKTPQVYQFASKEKLSQLENEFDSERRLELSICSSTESNSIEIDKKSTLKFDISYFRQLLDDLITHPKVYTFEVCPSACKIVVFVSEDLQLFENDIFILYREFIKTI